MTTLYVYSFSVVKTEVIVHIVIHKSFQCKSKKLWLQLEPHRLVCTQPQVSEQATSLSNISWRSCIQEMCNTRLLSTKELTPHKTVNYWHTLVPHLQCVVTATKVCLVDEDIRNSFLSSHLKQHLLVVGSFLWTEEFVLFRFKFLLITNTRTWYWIH